MRSIEGWYFKWPWRTPNPVFKVIAFLKSNISKTVRFRDKVTIRNTNNKPFTIYRMLPLSITLSDLWPRFQRHNMVCQHQLSFLLNIILLVVIFSASCVCPDILCIIRCSHGVQKCNNVTDLYELQDFCPLNSPDLNTFITKYGAASLPEKAQDMDDLRQYLIDAWFGVEQSVIVNGTVCGTGADVSMSAFEPQEDIPNIHRDIIILD